jgi:hypothetical protein
VSTLPPRALDRTPFDSLGYPPAGRRQSRASDLRYSCCPRGHGSDRLLRRGLRLRGRRYQCSPVPANSPYRAEGRRPTPALCLRGVTHVQGLLACAQGFLQRTCYPSILCQMSMSNSAVFFLGCCAKKAHTQPPFKAGYVSVRKNDTITFTKSHQAAVSLGIKLSDLKKIEIETAKTNCRNRKLDHSRAETFEILMLSYPVLAKRYYTHNLLIMDCKASASNLSICDISARRLWQPIARVRKRLV